jgi:hypothetical protein
MTPAPLRLLAVTAIVSSAVNAGAAADYYISASGSDAAAGTSAVAAWKTIAAVNAAAFHPGDRIRFAAGETFAGTVTLDASDQGTAAAPVVITSYGTGRATIAGGTGGAIAVTNCGGVDIRDIDVVGAGATNTANGILVFTDFADGRKLPHIVIDHVDVSGFGQDGIGIGSWHASKPGYDGVRVSNCIVHGNKTGGMRTIAMPDAASTTWAHRDVYVGHCTFRDNPGDPAKTDNQSGSGCILAEVDGGVIEYCEAYGNGAACAWPQGGPGGLWTVESNDVVLQHNESHHNRTGAGSTDGAGFDLDGGTTNCVLQYNYAHDNDGAGFLTGDYPGSRPTSGNTIRYNVSENDGRAHGFCGIVAYAGSGCRIYHNTAFVSPAASGSPCALHISGSTGASARNNLLVASGGLTIADVSGGALLQGNAYDADGGTFLIRCDGIAYSSLAALRTATGQERITGTDVGMQVDQALPGAGSAGTVGDPTALATLAAYRLAGGSPLIGGGLDLAARFGVDRGPRDFFATVLPQGAPDIGAHEWSAAASTTGATAGTAGGSGGTAGVGSPSSSGGCGLGAGAMGLLVGIGLMTIGRWRTADNRYPSPQGTGSLETPGSSRCPRRR